MIRSINTTIALLLPLLAILIFGGPTLKDFAFALTIGVVTGTYSSFFVASPMVVLWKEREPRYRKRLAAAGAAGAAGVMMSATVDLEEPGRPAALHGTAKSTALPGRGGGGAKPGAARVSRKPKKGKTSKRPPAKAAKRPAR